MLVTIFISLPYNLFMLFTEKSTLLPVSLQRLVDLLKEESKTGLITPLRAKEIVLEADVQESDMMQYADFDHPVEDCYGRKMVHDCGKFEVMVMSWRPRDYSSIHNHGYTQWGVVQVFGPTHHFIYHVKNGQLRFSKKEFLPKGTAIKVNNALIHQMGNATSDNYLTLHVYGSNVRDADITADAQNYDLELERIAHTTGGAFFNLSDSEVYDFEKAPAPTPEVFSHYAGLLLDYYNRQEQTAEIQSKRQYLFQQIEKWGIE